MVLTSVQKVCLDTSDLVNSDDPDDYPDMEYRSDYLTEQWDSYIKNESNPRFKKPTVVAFYTRYTDRLLDNEELAAYPGAAFAQNDLIWEPEGTDWVIDAGYQKALDLTRGVHKDGCVGLVDFDMANMFDFVDFLGDIQYCGFCCRACVYLVEWFTSDENDEVLAVVSIDTESG